MEKENATRSWLTEIHLVNYNYNINNKQSCDYTDPITVVDDYCVGLSQVDS